MPAGVAVEWYIRRNRRPNRETACGGPDGLGPGVHQIRIFGYIHGGQQRRINGFKVAIDILYQYRVWNAVIVGVFRLDGRDVESVPVQFGERLDGGQFIRAAAIDQVMRAAILALNQYVQRAIPIEIAREQVVTHLGQFRDIHAGSITGLARGPTDHEAVQVPQGQRDRCCFVSHKVQVRYAIAVDVASVDMQQEGLGQTDQGAVDVFCTS